MGGAAQVDNTLMKKQVFITVALLFIVVCFVVGGLWGAFFAVLGILKIILTAITFIIAVLPLWALHRMVTHDVVTEDGAWQAGTKWWLNSYRILCFWIIVIPWTDKQLIKMSWKAEWIQLLFAALFTFPIGLVAFYLKKNKYSSAKKNT